MFHTKFNNVTLVSNYGYSFVFRKYYLLAKNRERVVVECLAELFQCGSVHAARTNIIFKLYLNRNDKKSNRISELSRKYLLSTFETQLTWHNYKYLGNGHNCPSKVEGGNKHE